MRIINFKDESVEDFNERVCFEEKSVNIVRRRFGFYVKQKR